MTGPQTIPAPLDDDSRWAAVVACDPAFDARFLYGVATTGVFCRPSCRSRTPRRENVVYFADAREAQARGFRPCARCRPDLPEHDPAGDRVEAARRVLLEHLEQDAAGATGPPSPRGWPASGSAPAAWSASSWRARAARSRNT